MTEGDARLAPIAEIEAAARILEEFLVPTPLLEVPDRSGLPLWIKPEVLQPTGSFKVRGVVHAVARLSETRRREGLCVTAYSTPASWRRRTSVRPLPTRSISSVQNRVLVTEHASTTKRVRSATIFPHPARTPALPFVSHSASSGVCDRFWSGTNDVVDFTGLSCQNPYVLEKTIWAIASLLWLSLVVKHVKAIRYQLAKFERVAHLRGKTWHASEPLRILVPSFVVTIPTIVVVCLLRVATDSSIGTDAAVTFLYCVGVFLSFLLRSETVQQIMMAITTGITLNPENKLFLKKIRVLYLSMNVWYVFTGAGPLIGSVFVDSASSVEARTRALKIRTYLLLLRNGGAIVYYVFLAVYSTLWLRFARRLTKMMDQSSTPGVVVAADVAHESRVPRLLQGGVTEVVSRRRIHARRKRPSHQRPEQASADAG